MVRGSPEELEGEFGPDLLGPGARHVRVLFLGRRRKGRDAMFAPVGHATSAVRLAHPPECRSRADLLSIKLARLLPGNINLVRKLLEFVQ